MSTYDVNNISLYIYKSRGIYKIQFYLGWYKINQGMFSEES